MSSGSPQPEPPVPAVTVIDAHRRSDGVILLDVREPSEWADGHAPGAVLLSLGQLDPTDFVASAPVYVICRSGNRSATATRALVNAGVDAYNVVGGMTAWTAAGFPVSHD
jgi:rhodanese-related sulfurtransferase